jgi:hypothetical protein
MTYTKKQFGLELKEKIVTGSSTQEISRWAFKVYIDHGLEFESGLDYYVLKLVAMEEGVEFSLTRDDLILLANELIGINDEK